MTGHFGEMIYSMLELIQGDGSGTLVPLIAELSPCQLFTSTKGQYILKNILCFVDISDGSSHLK